MRYKSEVRYLTNRFYVDHPDKMFPEIERKSIRPYACLFIASDLGYDICIPFRSNIHHKYAYMFRNSKRSKQKASGLDYSKVAIIVDRTYIDFTCQAIVDRDEYSETMRSLDAITDKAIEYVRAYVAHVTGQQKMHDQEFNRRYRFSTLPYYHTELGIDATSCSQPSF